MMSGCGVLAAAQHSQSLEAWICHTPGLKVVMPSNPYDAKGLHVAAVRDDNPVVIVETKTLIQMECPVPDGLYEVPIGVANVVKEGADFTVVAIGHLVGEAQRAAQTLLDEDGIDLEIVDPRSLQPLDVDTLVTSVAKTHRALVAHEAVRSYGAGAEIAAQIAEHAFDDLDAPVGRIGAPFAPVPFSPVLEAAYRPGADQIVAEVRRILRRS
jgi:pyruvate/2-oxoglutarate/acetoin dehydrogenase E1 component